MPRKIKLFEGDNIDTLYHDITKCIVTEGTELIFGSQREIKHGREIFAVVQIYGKAISDILAGKTPKDYLWSGQKIRKFMNSFIQEITNPTGFVYTYPELLKSYPMGDDKTFDQLHAAKEALAYDKNHGLQGNRNVGILWSPIFVNNDSCPCFNWFKVRYLGNGKVSLILLFRSQDHLNASWGNLCSIGYAFNYFVISPNLCTIDEIILISDSAHIYENDTQQAEGVINTPLNITDLI